MVFSGRPTETLFSEEDYDRRLAHARAVMASDEERGRFPVAGGEIAFRFHPLEGARGVVVIVHGFTEFEEKYDEMTWYLLDNGYAVFRFDLRGHGHSLRSVSDPELTHVDRFEDYVDDLDALLKEAVCPRAKGLPLFLLGHSMGGAVVARYLMRADALPIAKAVLSSPMVCPQTRRFPRRLLMHHTRTYAKRYGWTAKFPHSRPFNPNPTFEASSDGSLARFREHIRLRVSDPCYRNSAATIRWMLEALGVKERLLDRRAAARIACPVLIVSCGRDAVVRLHPQVRFLRLLKQGERVFLRNAKHTPFTGGQPVIGAYYDAVLRFLEK